jgi:hypothetical protein
MNRLRIVVLGYIVRGPIGGMTWHHLQYLLGLRGLGHDVFFIEDSDDYPSCYDPARGVVDENPAYGLSYCDQVMVKIGMERRWAYYDAMTSRWLGPCFSDAREILRTADVLINVSGVNPLRDNANEPPIRILIDTDPLFTQVRHLNEPARLAQALGHTAFFTFGESIPAGDSRVPDDGIAWQATRQPVCLESWPVTPAPSHARFTTVMQWDSYRIAEHCGQTYGMKADSFEQFAHLPTLTSSEFEIALGSSNAPRERLRELGWRLRDPLEVSRDPWNYQRYIQNSLAEFSVAKHGYVAARTGWFSERSACYLASGRPCIVQDTGFPRHLCTGEGLLAFNTVDEAIQQVGKLHQNYANHSRSARQLAEQEFDAARVLGDLLTAAYDTGRS